jgi:hypothetical protein
VAYAWDVHYAVSVSEGFLLQVAEAWVGYVVQTSVSEHFEQWFVINGKDEIRAAEGKVAGLVKCVNHGQGLTLDRRIP